jgi:membrane-associated phospholipid phosphatase
MEFAARFFSWAFLPLLIPVYCIAAAFYLQAFDLSIMQPDSLFFLAAKNKDLLVYLFIAFSVVFPVLSILFFRIQGSVSSIMMDRREERLFPAVVVNGCAAALYFVLQKLDPQSFLPYPVYALVSGSFITVLVCTVVTYWWKISLHSAGMGILTGFVFWYFPNLDVFPFWILPLTVFISGLVLSARMYLKCHSAAEIFAGYGVGTIVVLATMAVFSR